MDQWTERKMRAKAAHAAARPLTLRSAHGRTAASADRWRSAGVNEYIIDQEKTAFRWWSKPFSPAAIQQTSFEQSGDMCVTKFAFTSSSIAGAKLNTTGWNRLIWAVNKATAYPGYHTEGLRGHITIDFSSGAILPQPTKPPSAPTPTAAPTAKAGVFSDIKTTSGTAGACPHERCCGVGTCHTLSDSPRCALPSRSHEARVAFGHVPHGAPTESATRLLGLLQALPACASRSRRCARSCSQSATL
jgi:hypothetical protein